MRIAMLGSRGVPARSGGVETVVEALTGQLAARGHEVIVYARRHYVGRHPHATAGRVITTPGLNGKHLDTITHTVTASVDLLFRRADVVHIHSPGPALMSWLPALAGIPIVFTVHAPDWRRDKWSSGAKIMLNAGLKCGIKRAAEITSVSRELAEELSQRFGKFVHYIPNAPPLEISPSKQLLENLGIKEGSYGLYVGRIVEEKRLDLLLKAWANSELENKLVVAGDWNEARYGRQCRKTAPPNAIFVGTQYGSDLAGIYAHAAVVIHPSVLEGMSLVLLEAANYGRCIIATDLPENREILGEAGLYFNRDDLNQLTVQIRRCFQDKRLRDSFGTNARNCVEKSFGWAAAAQMYENLYRMAVRG